MIRFRLPILSLLCVFAASACAGFPGAASPQGMAAPPEFEPQGNQTKCNVTRSQLRPLIVEWSSADRAALEVLAQRGPVVVRYTGCELEILPRCRAPGKYDYSPTTRKTEHVVIRDEDELWAQLPTGAAKLEGKLQRSGQLDVRMNVVGQYGLAEAVDTGELQGDCSKATHAVTGMTVGAFEFSAGGAAEAGGGATVMGAGGGVKSAYSRETLSSDGSVAACEHASRQDLEPPPGCGALLRLEMAPVEAPEIVGGLGAACPPGQVLVNGACASPQTFQQQPSQLFVRVECGLQSGLLSESEGLKVWIDGELRAPLETQRAINVMSPGEPGPVLFVAYDIEPGEHRVRVEADDCAAKENTIRVKPGETRDVSGRLEPMKWHERMPGSAYSLGLAVNYELSSFGSVKLDNSNYVSMPVNVEQMSGYGAEVVMVGGWVWSQFGFNWMSGDASFVAPGGCKDPADCLPAGTLATGEMSGWHIPLLLGGRLPIIYGSILAGTGIELTGMSLDAGAADDELSVVGPMGGHVPLWLGFEARPFCPLGLGARVARGLALGDDIGDYTRITVSLNLHATIACGASSFGIQ